MDYLFNCNKCKKKIVMADKHGYFHAFCTAIVDDRKQPIHFNSFKREYICDEYEEQDNGQMVVEKRLCRKQQNRVPNV